jgi:hypothetical protein
VEYGVIGCIWQLKNFKTVCRYHILVHFFVFDREDKSLECLKTERLTTMGCGSLLDRNYKRHHDLVEVVEVSGFPW